MGVLAKEIEANYEVLSKMGEGGMGAVYKVRHRFFDEIRVIKVMHAQLESGKGLKERFLGEAKRGKQLRHPNLAEVIDFVLAADGTAYIVMEFIEGVNLRELLGRSGGRLDYKTVIPIAEQALAALGFLHGRKFVHRDISPDNLMVTRGGDEEAPRVKLIDLGIAKSLDATSNLTVAGTFIGKVQYASPEQFGGEVDGRSDLYSLGVVLYELLTNSKPITGTDYMSIIAGHLTRPPRSFAETDPHHLVPSAMRAVVLKALEKRPEDRFPTAAVFAEALRATVPQAEQQTLAVPFVAPLDVTTPVDFTSRSEQVDWDNASTRDSVTAWEQYLERHPHSARVSAARQRLEQLEETEEADWNEAAKADSMTEWRSYLQKHPDSSRASKARRRLDRLEAAAAEDEAWTAASEEDSAGGWRRFLTEFEESARSGQARQNLARAEHREAEEQAWLLAERSDSSVAWAAFLDRYPRSSRGSDAKRRRSEAVTREERAARERAQEKEKVELARVLSAGTRADLERFIDKHRTSPLLGQAVEALHRLTADEEERRRRERDRELEKENEEREWTAALAANTPAAYEDFVRRHPRSPRTAEARQAASRIREHEAEQQREREAALQREREAALQREREAALQREREAALQREREAALQREREAALQREREAALQREREAALQREHEAELQRLREERVPEPVTMPAGLEPLPVRGNSPATDVDLPLPLPARVASPVRRYAAAGFGALLLLGLVATWLWRRDEPLPAVHSQSVLETSVPAGGTVAVTAPPAATGQLFINALPWGQVTSVTDSQGEERLRGGAAYTPVVLPLLPGPYKVRLSNPNSRRTVVLDAQVTAGALSRCETVLDRVDAREYLKRVGQ